MSYLLRIWSLVKSVIWKGRDIILLVTCLILIFFVFFYDPKPPKIDPSVNVAVLKTVKLLKDENDKMVAIIDQVVVEREQAKKYADSLAKALRLKPKYIKGVDVHTTEVDTVFKERPYPVYITLEGDTSYQIQKKDGYLDLTVTIGKNIGLVSLNMKDTLTRTEVVKTPLFGRTTRAVYLRNASPYVKVNEGYAWKTKEKEAVLTVGPYVGYDPFQRKVSAGISVQYPLIKIKR